MADEITKKNGGVAGTGEVVNTATGYTATDVLGNTEVMKEILKSDAVKALIQSEADRVRTKAAQEKESQLTEFAKYKQETDSKIAELSKFQKDYFKTETLKKSGLDVDLWGYVNGDTEADILKSAEALKTKIAQLAQVQVGGQVPTDTKSYSGLTKEQFGKMTYTEKAELYQKDKDLYFKMSKGE